LVIGGHWLSLIVIDRHWLSLIVIDSHFGFEFLNLFGIWNLEFGIWNLEFLNILAMKKLPLSFFVFHFSFFVFHSVSAQWGCACLPEGVTFTTQAQIDNFQANYPGCLEIAGDVTIQVSEITNLNGLSVLTSIGGNLYIYSNDALASLTGLDNLTYIGSDLHIYNNNALTNLAGLDNLVSIGGELLIFDNDDLTSLTGLEGLTSIGDYLSISANDALTNLSGLNNLDIESIGDLTIAGNHSLSSCNEQIICDYLASPNGSINIYDNATGCDSPIEVANACGITLQCLPFGNYYFLSQADIDDFQLDFPNCTALQGDVTINGNDITNLLGLDSFTSIGGDLEIYNPPLTRLTGLNNLTSIGGNLVIGSSFYLNNALTSLTGLEGLTSIMGYLVIQNIANLTNLTGLDNLTSIGKGLGISFNDYLASLAGLEGLTSIGDGLYIYVNAALFSLTGLEGLTSISGELYIDYNNALTSLSGLNNIDVESIGDLTIINNHSLSTCNEQIICDYLASPNGSVNIYENATGCDSPIEVANACGITIGCLPFGNYYFFSQADIDDFQSDFPYCTALEGNVTIYGSDITNLTGLNNLTSIGGDLQIGDYDPANPALTSLTGLENLTSIGGDLHIFDNLALTSLTGLEGLTSIGGNLPIHYNYALNSLSGLENLSSIGGGLGIGYNNALTSLTGLEGLMSCGSSIYIGNNAALSSLTGLENVEANTISGLNIYLNSSLSTCAVQSICDYLAAPNGGVNIHDNATGCDSEEEVEAACAGVGVDGSAVGGQRSAVSVYPNPTSGIVDFRLSLSDGQWKMHNGQWTILKIYDVHGREVSTVLDGYLAAGEHVVQWDATGLPAGIFLYRLEVGGQQSAVTGKMVKW